MPLMFALALSAAATTAAPPSARPICRVSGTELVDARQPPRIVRLDRMPPAKQLIAVLHTENGCEKPIVVSDQVGMNRR